MHSRTGYHLPGPYYITLFKQKKSVCHLLSSCLQNRRTVLESRPLATAWTFHYNLDLGVSFYNENLWGNGCIYIQASMHYQFGHIAWEAAYCHKVPLHLLCIQKLKLDTLNVLIYSSDILKCNSISGPSIQSLYSFLLHTWCSHALNIIYMLIIPCRDKKLINLQILWVQASSTSACEPSLPLCVSDIHCRLCFSNLIPDLSS